MKLTIKLGNLSKVLAAVTSLQHNIEAKKKEFLQKLAEIGVDKARVCFSTAEYDGSNDVAVQEPVWLDEDTICVRAQGSSILFIEFGSGVHYSTPEHELAEKFGYERGEYGDGRGKNDFWYYIGEPGTHGQVPHDEKLAKLGLVYTHGNPANRCMWKASEEMKSKIRTVAKEVFGK